MCKGMWSARWMSCWCSSSDNIVFPPALATIEGAQLHQVEDAAHMQLLFDERVWQHCLQLREQLQSLSSS